MKEQIITIDIPGKLMIAGEYAVLEPETSGIILAVNRYIRVEVMSSKEYGISSSLKSHAFHWDNQKGKGLCFPHSDLPSPFVFSALDIGFEYLELIGVTLKPFHIKITSQLDDKKTGKKYGLGSSAAIIVGIITAMLEYFKVLEKTTLETRFYLCAVANLKAQGSGSCADIAACIYGGWIWFRSFPVVWLLEKIQMGEGLDELLKVPWHGLKIKSLTPPADLYFYSGWTKEVAKTPNMVKQILEFKLHNPESYHLFLKRSNDATERLIQGFSNQDTNIMIDSIEKNRQALLYLGQESGLEIETKELRTLCEIGNRYGASKPSGAGGGDCGIVLTNHEVKNSLWRAWEHEGIQPLDLNCEISYKV